MNELEQLRKQIDQLDEQLVAMLNARAKVVVEIGKLKHQSGGAVPIYAPDRERAVLDKVMRSNQGPLPDRCLLAIYRELMSGSFFLERPLRIAYLGPEGSFSHNAAVVKFGQSVEYDPQLSIRGVFEEIDRRHCDLGVVPVENSIAGGIVETLDSLVDSTVKVCAEVLVGIHHNLMAACQWQDVKRIYSRPEVFSQCHDWLSSTAAGVELMPTASSAQAAQKAAQEAGAAAIGATLAAELYGLKVLYENIEDNTNNVTRFFVIGHEVARATGDDKTSLAFSTAHKAGALVNVLDAFRSNNVNLTNIESRPSRKREREYYFFVDCQGHQTDESVKAALAAAKEHCLQLSVLGSYPRSTEIL